MQYVVVHNGTADGDISGVGAWAMDREQEGWSGVAVADHLHTVGGVGWMHPFVTLGVMASATDQVLLTTVFANNLLRSPVDVAQAALTLHVVSGGRFEVGVGAGWLQDEIVGAGLPYPPPQQRARRFREAVQVVRAALQGAVAFEGEFYTIDLPAVGPACSTPPRLSAALGGPWTLQNIGPLVDHIEVFPAGPAVRTGIADLPQLGQLRDDDITKMIDAARTANPSASISLSTFVAAGEGPVVDYFAEAFAGGPFDGLAGSGARVARALLELERFDVDRITLVESLPGTAGAVAPHLGVQRA